MKRHLPWLLLLGLLTAWVVRLAMTRGVTGDDFLTTVILGVPLLYWALKPSVNKTGDGGLDFRILALGAVLLLLGSGSRSLLLMGGGWAVFAAVILQKVLSSRTPGWKIGLLLFLLVPWVLTDVTALGWWFRLSAATISEWFYATLGFSVSREGTMLVVNSLNVSVEEACSGMNQLHLLLFTGAVLAVKNDLPSGKFWTVIALLPLFAWIANTIRVILITAAGLGWGVEFAAGIFHTVGGALVFGIMLAACWTTIQKLNPPVATSS